MHLLLCGHGYLGQAVSRDFTAAGWKVSAVSREIPPQAPCPGIDLHTADLSDAASIATLATNIPRPDFIVHCASSGRGGAEAYRAVYLQGCQNLIDCFPGTPLLFTSSSSVYAQTDGSIVTEESPALPDRETGHLLRAAEDLVLASGGHVFRLSGIYGPHRSIILRKFLTGEAVIEEDGRRFLNQIHRDDAASAILLAATAPLPSGIWNVTDSHPRSQWDTYQGLAEIFSLPLPPTAPRDLDRKRGWTHKQLSNKKLLSAGWQPRFPDFLTTARDLANTLG
ncbi:MAG: NAD-dependent epimerase/dehydratase family protein [Akkermansiaceae bacterium]|jgi:nucleoside-diphosphate-sugar epimerase|nr:NAD-dependent epimerase/dehydratase family protein [Akkermansiaceae bacterium]